MFTPLQDPNEIKNSLNSLIKQVRKGIPTHMDCTIGHPGKSKDHRKVFWHPQLKFWSCIQPEKMDEDAPDYSKYWCVFGHEDPKKKNFLLDITCEINPPCQGLNDKLSGLFVEDEMGKVHILHRGNLSVAKKKKAVEPFIDFVQNQPKPFQTVDVIWPEGTSRVKRYILLGCLDEPGLQAKIAEFVHAAARYKQQVRL